MKITTKCELCVHQEKYFKTEKPNNMLKILGHTDICHSCYMILSWNNLLPEKLVFENLQSMIACKKMKHIMQNEIITEVRVESENKGKVVLK